LKLTVLKGRTKSTYSIKPDKTLGDHINELIATGGFESFATELSATDTVSEIFQVQPDSKSLHIFVRLPADGEWFHRSCLLTVLTVLSQ
jgi:hypothetical protein